MNNSEFIDKFNLIHNHKYEYVIPSGFVITTNKKIDIKCKIHGIFNQAINNHIKGAGCKKCSFIKKGLNSRINKENIIKLANIKHNHKYDYSKVDFKYNFDKVTIICPEHGDFSQAFSSHYSSGAGCPQCSFMKRSKQKRSSNEYIIKLIPREIKDLYEFDLSDYVNSTKKISITCKTHNITYKQLLPSFIKGCMGCPKCKITSLGEIKIKNYLELNNIEYIPQYKFPDCKLKRTLSFDFYIPQMNVCIEFDGYQHYHDTSRKQRNGDNLTTQQNRDEAKNKYCMINNIKLIRIPYFKSKCINQILTEQIK